jgi:hypothetical protein
MVALIGSGPLGLMLTRLVHLQGDAGHSVGKERRTVRAGQEISGGSDRIAVLKPCVLLQAMLEFSCREIFSAPIRSFSSFRRVGTALARWLNLHWPVVAIASQPASSRCRIPPLYLKIFSHKNYLSRFGVHSVIRWSRIELIEARQVNPFWMTLFAFRAGASEMTNRILVKGVVTIGKKRR